MNATISGTMQGIITAFAAVGIDPTHFNLQPGVGLHRLLLTVTVWLKGLGAASSTDIRVGDRTYCLRHSRLVQINRDYLGGNHEKSNVVDYYSAELDQFGPRAEHQGRSVPPVGS